MIDQHIKDIKKISLGLGNVKLMEVCGGHTNTIIKHGIRDVMPKNVKLVSGPGCPVCVTSQYDIDCMIELAHQGISVATYGDMLRVPGNNQSLEDAKAEHGNVFEVYSTSTVIKLKEKYPDIVFFGVGFETTAPMTAFLLKNNVCVYSVHKLVPPALKILSEDKIDGFIDPGHVSAIIGLKLYQSIKLPQVIAGFTPERILRAIKLLLELIRDHKKIVVNGYPEVVKENGNLIAQKLLAEHFKVVDSVWRGLGTLPKSALEVSDEKLNAKINYKDIFSKVKRQSNKACRCGDILKGAIEPLQCPLYKKTCTPESPQGACMVSDEGGCAISFRYGK